MSEPLLQVKQLNKAFGALQATRDVSLDLYPGEIHALIGPNGAGKSTLISQITGNLPPDSGEILLQGEDITGLTVAERAQRGLGRSFQISSLADELSVRRNVMIAVQAIQGSSFRFWKPVSSDASLLEPVATILERLGLSDRAGTLVAELSHGERRLVEMACALALQPRALLLDEPMAGMGSEGTARMVKLLSELKHEVPILLIEHDMDAVFQLADRVSVLVSGGVLAQGTADEIRNHPAVREAYLGEETT
ncbi:ABC transporter ATP-binding protein [Natronospirillum operosum]|uniref:ABC transporter ATP-binding protein n=1 Tax=Natronospirillum operosum TaxID=2759953 RepID=A0A4Z0W8Q6_9GAMM|nr:ABC transporter ATP-binding protein [Natronospirillum operosum]TGG93369.1 ABC transporter ATP-binding protein [Natronospirillum operosum]